MLWQKWVWDGVQADSLIFAAIDVGQLTDEQLLELVRETPVPQDDTDITVKRGESYVSLSMNFQIGL